MALDKVVDSARLDSDLGDVADAIRAKRGGSGQLAFPSEFVSEIESIASVPGCTVEIVDFSPDTRYGSVSDGSTALAAVQYMESLLSKAAASYAYIYAYVTSTERTANGLVSIGYSMRYNYNSARQNYAQLYRYSSAGSPTWVGVNLTNSSMVLDPSSTYRLVAITIDVPS